MLVERVLQTDYMKTYSQFYTLHKYNVYLTLSPKEVVEDYTDVRCYQSHNLQSISLEMAVEFQPHAPDALYYSEICFFLSLGLISINGCENPGV
jgi:hypothetical protein